MRSIADSDEFECDRCGAPVGNGGIDRCSVVSDLDPDQPGRIINRHFCRDRTEDGRTVKGCTSKLFTPANLAHYRQQQNDRE